MKYSIDTSSLIHGWHRAYTISNFPGFWESVDSLIKTGELVAIREVKEELKRKDDELFQWVKERDEMFIEINSDIQNAVISILRYHEKLLDTRKGRSGADPFVIALAQVEKCTVVSQESFTHKPDKPNIPDVCKELGIKCIDLLQLIKDEGWVFGASR